MQVKIFKYIVRDLSTMKKVGYTTAEEGKEPVSPTGTFVSKCVDCIIDHRADPIIEVM